MSPVQNFFQEISPKILEFATQQFKKVSIVKQKSANENDMNFATHVDLGSERIITSEIKKRFPKDSILAEEEYANTSIFSKGRIWIIDPICGTANLSRQINIFVTNIALAENGKLIAACAIDHLEKTYYFSIGENKIYKEFQIFDTTKKSLGVLIDVDLFAARLSHNKDLLKKYISFIDHLLTDTEYIPTAYNSSLPFTYSALGKLDGFVSPHHHLWDVATPNFLMLQAGGIVTDINGNTWKFDSGNTIAAKDKKIHEKLVEIYQKSE